MCICKSRRRVICGIETWVVISILYPFPLIAERTRKDVDPMLALPLLNLVHHDSNDASAFLTKFRVLAGRTVLLVVKKSRILELLAFDE